MENNLKYFVNAKKGVVVCVITDCRRDATRRIWKYLSDCSYLDCSIPNAFVGTAKCNLKEDSFDEQYGKKLALTRAKRKRSQAINKAIRNYIKITKRELDNLEKYGIHEVPKVK